MKRIVIPLVILFILGLVGISQAQQMGFSVSQWSIGSGEITTGDNYKLSSVVNQPIVGSQSGGDFHLKWGFWHPPDNEGTIYLPMVAKPDQGPSTQIYSNEDILELDKP